MLVPGTPVTYSSRTKCNWYRSNWWQDVRCKNTFSTVRIETLLRAGRAGFGFCRGLGIFLFVTTSRPALGPTQPPIQWVPGAKVARAWSYYFSIECWAVPPFTHMSSYSGACFWGRSTLFIERELRVKSLPCVQFRAHGRCKTCCGEDCSWRDANFGMERRPTSI
jgi:hypothetical protein